MQPQRATSLTCLLCALPCYKAAMRETRKVVVANQMKFFVDTVVRGAGRVLAAPTVP